MHNIRDVRHVEIHIAEPLIPNSSYLEIQIASAKLRNYNSHVEKVKSGGEALLSVIHKLFNSIWISGRRFIVTIYNSVIIIVGYHCY
jgi:hypothetical protein